MSRRLLILERYADLCKLIEMWVVHDFEATLGALGYPKKSAGFIVKIQAGYVDVTGYSAWDNRAVGLALDALATTDRDLYAAVQMYYMPWTVEGMVAAGYPFPPTRAQTYYDRLERAHAWLNSEWRIQLRGLKYGCDVISSYADYGSDSVNP